VDAALDALADAARDGATDGGGLPVSTAAQLATESKADYADNEYGIITGATLARWIRDWRANRPQGVTGKLVVLQVVPNVSGSQAHVAGDGTNVVSYLVPQGELTQVRNNGLSQIEAEIPGGAATDAFLKKYAIDPLTDYVAITFEQLPASGSTPATPNAVVQQVGRAWLLLRYWGYPAERVGILNGSINWNATNEGLVLSRATPATPPNNGTGSVRSLRVDNTQLVITLDELLAILKRTPGATPLDDVRIVDARGGAEALGLLKSTQTGKTDCPSYTGTGANARCSPYFEGRIKGARSVPWTQFVDTAENGFRYLSKDAVKSLFDAQANYQAGKVTLQYCRTNVRSMVTGIVAGVILGYPTRFYDTSFIEWSHLAYGPTSKTRILAETSPYRTDLAALTEHATVTGYTPGLPYDPNTQTITGWVDGPNYNSDVDISNTPPLVVPSATTASKSVADDRAYKL
jgi:3-mercaptopyruvate sulfurtransferase SseA